MIALRGLEGALVGYSGNPWDFALTKPAVNAFDGLEVPILERWIVIVAALKIIISMTWFICFEVFNPCRVYGRRIL